MKSKLFFLILLSAILVSCKKTTNVDVQLSTSGRLTYKLIDDAGKGLPNLKVSLFDSRDNYSTPSILLDTRLTDSNGEVDFGDLNPANYLLVADSAKVNNVSYFVREYIQVVTGTVKHKETKVTDYSGTFNMTVRSYYNNNQPLKNIGVIMIPSNKYNNVSSTTGLLKIADFSGATNDAGSITFKIPSGKDYVIYLYNTVTNASYNFYSYISVQKDATTNFQAYIYQQ